MSDRSHTTALKARIVEIEIELDETRAGRDCWRRIAESVAAQPSGDYTDSIDVAESFAAGKEGVKSE